MKSGSSMDILPSICSGLSSEVRGGGTPSPSVSECAKFAIRMSSDCPRLCLDLGDSGTYSRSRMFALSFSSSDDLALSFSSSDPHLPRVLSMAFLKDDIADIAEDAMLRRAALRDLARSAAISA